MKERVTLTIEKDLLEKIDEIIDNTYIRNRSQAFEVILKERFEKKIKDALILGGGKSNKIPLLEKINNERILEMQIRKLKEIGIKNIYIIAGDNTEKIKNYVKNFSGIKINFLNENRPTGTAGAIKLAEYFINSTFFVIYGNVYFDFDLKKMLDFHKKRKPLVTLGVTTVEKGKSTDNLYLEGDRVKLFEHSPKSKTFVTNVGVQIFEPEIFKYLPKKGSLEKDVYPKLSKENKLLAYIFHDKWRHVK